MVEETKQLKIKVILIVLSFILNFLTFFKLILFATDRPDELVQPFAIII